MKNLTLFSSPSSSSSPSSLSTLSFEQTFCNPKSATSGCLSSILRRILCSRSLQTHPSHHIRNLHSMMASDKDEELKTNHKNSSNNEAAFCEPGVVAKLMGLETTIEVKQEASSVSSMEKTTHKSSSSSSCSSIHGVPTTFHLHENEDFLVLSFETNFKGRKNKNKILRFGEVEEEIMVCCEKACIDSSEAVKRKKRNNNNDVCFAKNTVANDECSSSEDSSPVSVFDFQRQLLQTDVDSFGVDLSWRRKLSPQLENEHQHVLSSDSDMLLLLEEEKLKANKNNNNHEMLKKTENQRHNDYEDIWGQICKLVEHDLFGSDQIKAARMRTCEIENICADFESQIFCYLLNELIDQVISCWCSLD